MSLLDDYLTESGRLPAEALLGNIFIMTIRDGMYMRDDIIELFESLQLRTEDIPSPATAIDAFRRATSDNREHTYTTTDGDTISLLIRKVTADHPKLHEMRVLAREERDGRKPALDWTQIGEFVFFKPIRKGRARVLDESSARMSFRGIVPAAMPSVGEDEWARVRDLVRQVAGDYERFRTSLDSRKLRLFLVAYMKSLGSIRLKDSTYFVPSARSDEAYRLREAVQSLGECRLDVIPLVNVTDQRDLIFRVFQEDTEDQMATLARELQEAHEAGKVSPIVFSRLQKTYTDLTERTALYTETMGQSMARNEGAHAVVQVLMHQLAGDLLNN